jgi:hypothetical protein
MTTFDQTHDDAAFADRDPSCDAVLERLPLHVGGDLEATLGARMDDHLAGCPSCAATAERMRAAFGTYFASEHRAAAEELGARSLWPDLQARLRGAAAAASDAAAAGAARDAAGGASHRASARDRSLAHGRDGHDVDLSPAYRPGHAPADDANEALELALQGAGTINERGVRGRTLLLVMAPLMAAAFVLAINFSGGSSLIGGGPTRGDLVDDRTPNAELGTDLNGLGGTASSDDTSSLVADESTGAPAASGLRRITPADDAERLIRQPLQVNDLIQDPRATGTLAGRSTWR